MVMYGSEIETKENKIYTKDKIDSQTGTPWTNSEANFTMPRSRGLD